MRELFDVSFSKSDSIKPGRMLCSFAVAAFLVFFVSVVSVMLPKEASAAQDPKGAFGFVWGESAEKVKTKAGSMKMVFLKDIKTEDYVLVYKGDVSGYDGLLIFRCKGDKLYAVTLTVMNDQSFKAYERMMAETTKKYGKPNDNTEQDGITVSGWNVGDTMISVGKFKSKDTESGTDDFTASSVYINMSVLEKQGKTAPTGKK